MSLQDKINNKIQQLTGKTKEGVGNATNDNELKAQGNRDQSKGDLKDAGEKAKDAFKD